jgi:hypothetical protein
VKQTKGTRTGKTEKNYCSRILDEWKFFQQNATDIERTNHICMEELIDVANIPDGVNTFNARFKDEYGVWSPVETRFFVKQSTALTEGNKNITNLEYWMDGNTANKVSKTITPNNPYHWEELIPTEDIPNGLHTFNVRWKDEKGIWTMVYTQFFVKMKISLLRSEK